MTPRGISLSPSDGNLVAARAEPPVDQRVGLEGMDQVDEPLGALGRHADRRVEPDQADRAVVGQQF